VRRRERRPRALPDAADRAGAARRPKAARCCLRARARDREARTVERRIRDARFPAVKSLESFDFDAIPGLNKKLVLDLARCEFVARRENVIALGPSDPTS